MTSAVAPHFRTFGRYEIVRKLGRSMSDVYLARDPIIGRLVVLKIVEQCSNAWSDAIAEAERRGAAIQQQLHAIDHRVLEIYDVGEQNGSFYVAMQYAEGRSVAELIAEKGRLNPGQAAQIAAEICSQLVSLHSFEAEIDGRKRAVVHGDIKPSNIQIGADGEVCLLDFGIAKAISATRKLTHHDLGSPAYCSPERLNTSLVDPQADLWAVAVSLYEMIAGIPPYQAQTTRKLESVIQSRRPPRALPSECPRPLRGIIQKGLAADPALRYQSAQDFENDLRSFLARKPASAEHELEHRWSANATVERPRIIEYSSRHHMPERLRVILSTLQSAQGSLLAGVLTGLFVFVPALQVYRVWSDSEPLRQGRDYIHAGEHVIDSDMALLARFESDYKWLGDLSPGRTFRKTLGVGLVAAADSQFTGYRTRATTTLDEWDWPDARACLQRALLLSPSDASVRGRLALADAYRQLLAGAQASDVFPKLTVASSLLPSWPDPHLALARFYIYRQKNLGLAIAEFRTAEKLGYSTGPREWEQEGDGYLARVEKTWTDLRHAGSRENQHRLTTLLSRDAARARQYYEPIIGFGNVSRSLTRLERIEDDARDLPAAPSQARVGSARHLRKVRTWR